jgi:hypothetical protein
MFLDNPTPPVSLKVTQLCRAELGTFRLGLSGFEGHQHEYSQGSMKHDQQSISSMGLPPRMAFRNPFSILQTLGKLVMQLAEFYSLARVGVNEF